MASGKGQILDFAILNHDDRLLASIVSGHLEDIYTERPKGSTKSPLRKQSGTWSAMAALAPGLCCRAAQLDRCRCWK